MEYRSTNCKRCRQTCHHGCMVTASWWVYTCSTFTWRGKCKSCGCRTSEHKTCFHKYQCIQHGDHQCTWCKRWQMNVKQNKIVTCKSKVQHLKSCSLSVYIYIFFWKKKTWRPLWFDTFVGTSLYKVLCQYNKSLHFFCLIIFLRNNPPEDLFLSVCEVSAPRLQFSCFEIPQFSNTGVEFPPLMKI